MDPLAVGGGRSSLWLTPNAPVRFKFAGSRVPAIDREWLQTLTRGAESGAGLVVCNARGDLLQPATVHHAFR
jgi:hypothetical protein